MMAKIKVMAGMRLDMEDANVADVNTTPSAFKLLPSAPLKKRKFDIKAFAKYFQLIT